ncbi:MAG: tetratricopeptide repeat protein [Bilifractor sp.]
MAVILKAALEENVAETQEKYVKEAPESLQDKVRMMLKIFGSGDSEQAEKLCKEILQEKPDYPYVQTIYGVIQFEKGKFAEAEDIFKKVMQLHPDFEEAHIQFAKVCHAQKKYKEAADAFEDILPLKEYQPMVYSAYGDVLENLGMKKKALKAFREDILQYDKEKFVPHEQWLDGVFQRTLELEVSMDQDLFLKDLEDYKDFLRHAQHLEKYQAYLADLIVVMSMELEKKWLRNPFLEFVTFVSRLGIMQGKYQETISSAYISVESWNMREDGRISQLLEDFVNNVYSEQNLEELEDSSDPYVANGIRINARSLCWQVIQYVPQHEDEISYFQMHYPQSYLVVAEQIGRARKDAAAYEDELLHDIQVYADMDDIDADDLRGRLMDSYQEMMKKQAGLMGQTGTYRRNGRKIGRNEPCPCGSGKKYKDCCGKNKS